MKALVTSWLAWFILALIVASVVIKVPLANEWVTDLWAQLLALF